MGAFVFDAGIWKRPLLANKVRQHVFDSGVWKLPKRGYAYNAGVWKPVFPPYVQYLGYTLFTNPGNQDFSTTVTVPEDCILVTVLSLYGPVARSITQYSVDSVAGSLVAVPSNNMKVGIGYKSVTAGSRVVNMHLDGGNGQSGVADGILAVYAVSGYRNASPATGQATGTATFMAASITVPDDSATIWAFGLGSNVTRTWLSGEVEDQYQIGPSGGRCFGVATLGYNTPGSYVGQANLSASVFSSLIGLNFT